MRPRELRLLWEVSRTGSVTAAAERIAMTQPAASALLRELEERLGFALFDREKRRLTFTAKGRALLPEIANALAALDSVSRLTESLRADAPQRVVIGSVAPAAATILPGGVRQLRESLPAALVSVRTAMSLEIESMVAEGRVDFGIVTREAGSSGPGCLRLCALPLYCVVDAAHPFAGREAVEAGDIARESYVSLGRQFTVGGATARLLEDTGAVHAPSVEVMHYSTACAFVRDGGCVAVLDALCTLYAPQLGLVAKPIRNAPHLSLDLLWSPHSSLAAHAQSFADGLIAALGGSQLAPFFHVHPRRGGR
jgi:DNA-binding transcriptional LysR family regulator